MYSSTENKDRAGIKLSDQLGSIFVCWLCGDASIWEQSRNVAEEQKGMPQLSDVPCITGGIVYACDPDSGNNDFSARTIRKELSMEKLVLFDGEI